MKGGNGTKRSSGAGPAGAFDGSPQRAATAAPIGSPAAASVPKRRPGKGYTTPPRASSDVVLFTPPGAQPPPGIPQPSAGAIPQAGCSLEELRVFTLFASNFNKDATEDLERRIAEQTNAFRQEVHERFNKIEPALDGTKDVSLFAKVAKLVTPEALQTKFDEFAGRLDTVVLQKKTFDDLTERLNNFAKQVQAYTLRTEDLEKNFKNHVDVAFQAIDVEFKKVKFVIDGIPAAAGPASDAASALSAARDGLLSSRVDLIEAALGTQQKLISDIEDVATSHAIEITEAANDMVQHKKALAEHSGKFPCHCPHVDLLLDRVVGLETAWNGRLTAGQVAAGVAASGAAPPPPQPDDAWDRYLQRSGRVPRFAAGAYAQAGAGGQSCPTGCSGGGCGGGGGAPHGSGGHGGPPGPGGPGGPGGLGMPQGNDSWPDLGHINFGRIFDDKIASNILYAYDGIKEGEKWIKKTRGYFMTKCPELKPILDYVEGMSEATLTVEHVIDEAAKGKWMTELDMRGLGQAIWGFLNTCLSGAARACFEAADELNGFDAWRLVALHIRRSQRIHASHRRRVAKNPPKIPTLQHVSAGLMHFQPS